jgi:pentatricopeptide repeat protein
MRALSVAAIRRHARLGLKCANRIPFGVFQCRSFAVAVADNHHRRLVGFIKPIDAPKPFAERPPEQQRADLTVHEQMMRSTQRILSLKSLTPGSVQELRVVLNYWTSSRPHAIAEAMDGGKHSILTQIDALLEWILSTKIDAESLYAILRTDECVSGALINMIEQHLMPFRGTHQSLKTLSDRRLRSNQNVDELKKALTNATKIMDIIETLFDDPAYPKLVPDAYACNMMLNLWVKRCWFLAENSDLSLDDNFVNTALKGVKNVEECLEAMEECIATLPPPGSSNATALYMAAWVNSNLPNRVEKLEAILQDAEENYPVPLNEVPYNVLMHAYASNAQYKKEYATRAGTLLRHMWSRGVECDVSTYSSLLLALSNAGNPDRAIELLMQMEEQAERTNIFPNTICYNIGTFLPSNVCIILSSFHCDSKPRAMLSSGFIGETDDAGICNESGSIVKTNGKYERKGD